MFIKKTYHHYIDFLFTLSLFCVYVICCITLILFGARIYNTTTQTMNDNFEVRTSYSYITEKIRQSDTYNALRLRTEQDNTILMLETEIDGITYATSLYEYDQHLYELFSRTDIELPLDAGQEIAPISKLHFKLVTPKLLEITFQDTADITQTIYVSLHSSTVEESHE